MALVFCRWWSFFHRIFCPSDCINPCPGNNRENFRRVSRFTCSIGRYLLLVSTWYYNWKKIRFIIIRSVIRIFFSFWACFVFFSWIPVNWSVYPMRTKYYNDTVTATCLFPEYPASVHSHWKTSAQRCASFVCFSRDLALTELWGVCELRISGYTYHRCFAVSNIVAPLKGYI